MKEINLKNVRKVEIEHEYFDWSHCLVCNVEDYIEKINYLVANGVKIISIKFYE